MWVVCCRGTAFICFTDLYTYHLQSWVACSMRIRTYYQRHACIPWKIACIQLSSYKCRCSAVAQCAMMITWCKQCTCKHDARSCYGSHTNWKVTWLWLQEHKIILLSYPTWFSDSWAQCSAKDQQTQGHLQAIVGATKDCGATAQTTICWRTSLWYKSRCSPVTQKSVLYKR